MSDLRFGEAAEKTRNILSDHPFIARGCWQIPKGQNSVREYPIVSTT